jgi:FtsP/CotA-like multicopper oxidase with cupredoxin domain
MSFPDTDALPVEQGKRYRLILDNKSGDAHPIHLHRHTFELTKVAGKGTSGVLTDVINGPRYQTAEVDFVADDPGLTLFHCHVQLHQDFGFMTLVKYLQLAPPG